MRILHLIPFLWSGAGDVVTRLAVSQEQNARVAVVTSGSSRGESDSALYRTRLQNSSVGHFQVDLFDRDPAVFWNSVSKLEGILAEFSPAVVHCHSGVPAAAAAAVRDSGSPGFLQIGQLHSWGEDRPAWMNTMDLWAFGRCDRVVCNSADYRQILLKSASLPITSSRFHGACRWRKYERRLRKVKISGLPAIAWASSAGLSRERGSWSLSKLLIDYARQVLMPILS